MMLAAATKGKGKGRERRRVSEPRIAVAAERRKTQKARPTRLVLQEKKMSSHHSVQDARGHGGPVSTDGLRLVRGLSGFGGTGERWWRRAEARAGGSAWV